MTAPDDPTQATEPESEPSDPHPHLHHAEEVADEVLDAMVETALEHGDGGDGGAPRKKRKAARLITVVGILLGGLAVTFVVRRLVQDWPEVSDQIGEATVGWLVVAGVCAALAMTSIGWGWKYVLRALGVDAPVGRVIAWYYMGELGKYVPGGVWPVFGRGELARRGGAPREEAYASVALSLGMLYLSAMFVATMFLPFALTDGGGFSPWMLCLLALPVGVVVLHHDVLDWLLARVQRVTKLQIGLQVPRWHVSLTLVARYIPTWLLIGTATYAIARSISTDVSYPRMMFAAVLSWVVGFLAVPVPSGAGIREAVLFAAAGVPKPIAITTAVGARLMFVIVDAGGAALAAPFLRRRQGSVVRDDDAEASTEVGASSEVGSGSGDGSIDR